MTAAEANKRSDAITKKMKPVNKETDIKTSFTAADSIPIKVLLDKDVIHHAFARSRLIPVHIQFLPTNKCNLNCKFCSCSERDKTQEIDFALAKKIIDKCKQLGTKSVTITGGGEPLLYSNFSALIEYFQKKEIKIGLVSNGLLLHRTEPETLSKITWCRISNSDERSFDDVYKKRLSNVINAALGVDWAFSHVVSASPNVDEIAKIINFANAHHFTHVRLVADLFQPQSVDMERLKTKIVKKGIDDSKVIYQERKAYTKGGDCFIGFLKPLIGADAKVYACCGVQYALEQPSRSLPEDLCLGSALDMENIIARSSEPLNGAICSKCYYMNYNILLKGLLKEIDHKEFV
jgi:MoaA/NifB/PqqE/SkfB family radical SAM enzyme